jgi:hypothetical protein
VTRALGFGLDQNALVALRQWRFHAGTRNTTPVPMDVDIEIGFTLRNESINAQIANDMVSLVGPGVTPPQAVRVVNPRWPEEASPAPSSSMSSCSRTARRASSGFFARSELTSTTSPSRPSRSGDSARRRRTVGRSRCA